MHWFTLYDQSALGRFDGENYNIGFLDVCNRAYEEMGRAAIASHERMHRVAAGEERPFTGALAYLPKLFLCVSPQERAHFMGVHQRLLSF